MMQKCNIVTWVLIAFWGAGLTSTSEAEARLGENAPSIGWADGEAAFDWAQSWLRREEGVPADADLPQRAVTDLFGIYITLRDEGKVLGRGQAIRSDIKDAINQPGRPVQLAPLLAIALRQALDELKDKQTKRAIQLGIEDRDKLQLAIHSARQRAQLDIQLGHSLESVVLPARAKEHAVLTTFAPGYHGLRLAGPLAGKADYAWPAIELARNHSAPRTVYRLMNLQGYDADELSLVARADGPALQRFQTIHLVRPRSDQPMRQLIRGNVLLKQQVIDSRTIVGLAERIAQHLDQRIVSDTIADHDRVRGTYQPSLKRYAPQWADAREVALLSYAMTRHSAVALDAGVDKVKMQARAKRVLDLADRLVPTALPDGQPPKHLTAAFLLLTYCQTPVKLTPDQLVMRDRLGQALLSLKHPQGGGYRVQAGQDKRLPRASAAVLTAALAAYYKDTRSKSLAKPVWQVLSDLMQANATIDDSRPADLLWVAHALDAAGPILAKAQPDPDAASQTLGKWRNMLAAYLEFLAEHQIRSKPLVGPEDVVGGFVLEQSDPGTPPEPNWQSAMPTALFALGLRDSRIIPPDRQFGPVLTAGLAARYLGQLIMTRPSGYYLREPEPALGGVRRTLWDNTLYLDCSAMTLIALVELHQTLLDLEPGQ